MITQDYINGYINALKTVEDNINHRLQCHKDVVGGDHNNTDFIAIENELESILDHLDQLRESYKQLVKDLNGKIKS